MNAPVSKKGYVEHQGETNCCFNLQQENLLAFPLLFAEQLAKTPNNTAIVFEDREYTYLQLDQLSEQFKHAILLQKTDSNTDEKSGSDNELSSAHHNDVGSEQCIGICIDKSPEAIAAMLGILKAGAAFVPLDPEYPTDRIAYMVADASIDTIIIQPNHQETLAPIFSKHFTEEKVAKEQTIHWINCYQPLSDEMHLIHRKVEIEPSDLAYIMYTSGSTGKPKGVQIEHAALATYCYADIDVYQVQESDRTLQFSTINFDIAIEEIFPPLLTGGCIVIRPAKRSDHLNELSSIINDNQVTAVHIATAYWHEWVDLMTASGDLIPESLRLMVVTGEKVSTKHYQRWKQLCSQSEDNEILWCNAYGPTEATVSASVFIPDENFFEDNMPIGMPLKRYKAMIVDEDYNNLPAGETGQLLIGGPALARGYLNRPELNAEVFVEVTSPNNKAERMYKTGDLARWLPDGNIEFAGRIDHQIKLGSYRIEPGEIEVAINQHEQVLESLITYDEIDGKKALIAYIAIGEEAINNRLVTSYQLSSFLQQNLPAYMVPARYVLLASFPKTTNGKIDRQALPEPSQSEVPRSSSFVVPRNELEQKLSRMWQEVLQLPEVSIHDDFFALGGSSLLAVGVVSRLISDLKLELPVRDFFANPTIASQAKHINQMLGSNNGFNSDSDNTSNIDNDSRELRKRLPKVHSSYFKSGQNKLYGVHYQPQNGQLSHSRAVLICHPLGHEYPRSYRNLQQFSIQLGQAGFDTFRFDYAGTGNSSGKNDELTAEQCIADIQAAAAYIREQSQCQHLSIIAVRMGAPLAVKAMTENGGISGHIDNLIIWDPVIHGSNYIKLLHKFHHKTLSNLERFRQIRRPSSIKQLYGHAMSAKKHQSLLELSMPFVLPSEFDESLSTTKQILITSTNYLPKELGCEQLTSSWQHFYTSDSIYWHDHKYTESAFSSPQAFQVMMTALEGGRN